LQPSPSSTEEEGEEEGEEEEEEKELVVEKEEELVVEMGEDEEVAVGFKGELERPTGAMMNVAAAPPQAAAATAHPLSEIPPGMLTALRACLETAMAAAAADGTTLSREHIDDLAVIGTS
jgi:hypothetical protein